ncbi:hypothetical protein [Desulfobulbus sp.]|uniref:hypothetical protein n=1 Tax=Desulfobulbus sp. TaxID=895 RepID=UPI00286F9D59|nr:hypothetical protein [Desulfobulbus sp.]
MLHFLLADFIRQRRLRAGEKTKKGAQIGTVGGDGILGQPPLDGQVAEKIRQVRGKGGGVQGRVADKRGKTNAPTADRWGMLFTSDFSIG